MSQGESPFLIDGQARLLRDDLLRCLRDQRLPFVANDVVYTGNFVKIALNVAHRKAKSENALPDLLRSWFGPDAGQPGTAHYVELASGQPHWQMRPAFPAANRDQSIG